MAQIIPLSEGTFTIDSSKEFVPFDANKDNLKERAKGSLLVEVQPFLVIMKEEYILLDTGLGFKDNSGNLQIYENLIKAGINPMDITKVLLTHLHKDHAGGVSIYDEMTDERIVSFPQAIYYINKKEMDYALEEGYPSYHPDEIQLLNGRDNVVWLEGEGLIDGFISYWQSGGHSPYHQVFLLNDGKDKLFFGADEAPQLSQMKSRFIAKYDYDGKKAMMLRKEFVEKAVNEDWTFLYYHDTKTPFAKWK